MSLFINGIVISVHWYVQWPVKQLITHINLFTRSSCCCDAYACSLACLWRHWSDDTFLGRNENKHESDYFSAKGKKNKNATHAISMTIGLCLSVVIDSQLPFVDNVKKLAGSCFYQLWQLSTVCCSLTTDAAVTLAHALISASWITATVSSMASVKQTFIYSRAIKCCSVIHHWKEKVLPCCQIMRDDLH